MPPGDEEEETARFPGGAVLEMGRWTSCLVRSAGSGLLSSPKSDSPSACTRFEEATEAAAFEAVLAFPRLALLCTEDVVVCRRTGRRVDDAGADPEVELDDATGPSGKITFAAAMGVPCSRKIGSGA